MFFDMCNSSELPLNIQYTTRKHLDTLNFSNNDNEQIIQNLDRNKAQGHKKISISMIKIYGKLICRPLQFTLINKLTLALFCYKEKKNNVP